MFWKKNSESTNNYEDTYSHYGNLIEKYCNTDISLIHQTYENPTIRGNLTLKDGEKLCVLCRKYVDENNSFMDVLVIRNDLIIDSLRFDIIKDKETLIEFFNHLDPDNLRLN